MDFSRVALSEDQQRSQDDVRSFPSTVVTDQVIQRDRKTGENFDEGVHRALGDAGYLRKYYQPEADGGSDVATCKTRAVRDGAGWITNGSRMFTSYAQNAQYVFLITKTDRDAAKHQSLTMFLVPMNSPPANRGAVVR